MFSVMSNFSNVPNEWINKQKSNQHWLKKEGEKFIFPGGGTMFPNGVAKYVDLMQDLIPEMKDGTIRTAIDTGCGLSVLFFLFLFIYIGNGLQNNHSQSSFITSLITHADSFSCWFLTAAGIYFKIILFCTPRQKNQLIFILQVKYLSRGFIVGSIRIGTGY